GRRTVRRNYRRHRCGGGGLGSERRPERSFSATPLKRSDGDDPAKKYGRKKLSARQGVTSAGSVGSSCGPEAVPRGLVHSGGVEFVLDALVMVQRLDGAIGSDTFL